MRKEAVVCLPRRNDQLRTDMSPIAVFTTVGSLAEARKIARALVERKLVACAQISEIESFYSWKGVLQNDREFRILFKTVDVRYDAVEAAIRELHSYDLPAIHATALARAYAPYAAWVVECSASEQ